MKARIEDFDSLREYVARYIRVRAYNLSRLKTAVREALKIVEEYADPNKKGVVVEFGEREMRDA